MGDRKLENSASRALKALPAGLETGALPEHIAIIMDGNGRWASRHGFPRVAGHRRGARTLKEIVRCCRDWGVGALTVYAFSTENWQRPTGEVNALMTLFEWVLRSEVDNLHREGVRIRVIGDTRQLPVKLQDKIIEAVAMTRRNRGLQFSVAVNYGGRQEIVRAVRRATADMLGNSLGPQDLTCSRLSGYLDTSGLPDPSLVIRTGGERRISNFLLWQSAHSEFFFSDCLWPDFHREELYRALQSYQAARQRRHREPGASLPADLPEAALD